MMLENDRAFNLAATGSPTYISVQVWCKTSMFHSKGFKGFKHLRTVLLQPLFSLCFWAIPRLHTLEVAVERCRCS